ncbi:hypothetical protein D3C81_793280 [compost metagenome]
MSNNPLKYTDPSGHSACDENGENCVRPTPPTDKGTGKTITVPDKVTGEVNGKSKYKVAVGPGIINPNYSDNGKLWASDITSSNKYISVNLEDKKTKKIKTIQCVVVDLKAHTFNKYPAGQKYDTGDKAHFDVKMG